jgi:hypothetical protein
MRSSSASLARSDSLGLEADAAQQQVAPLGGGELLAPLGQNVQHLALGELDGAQRLDTEGPPALLLGDRGVVAQRDLGIEAAGQHALVLLDHLGREPHVVQAQAGQVAT